MSSQTGSPETPRSSAVQVLRSLVDFFKKHRDVILLIAFLVLALLATLLVIGIANNTFSHEFKCAHLIDETLGLGLCDGVNLQIPSKHIIVISGVWEFDLGPFPPNPIQVLPALSPINGPLEALRRFVSWNIILAFAVASLALAFIGSKILYFIGRLATPEGRREILINISLWLLVFAVFTGWFYGAVVVPALGK